MKPQHIKPQSGASVLAASCQDLSLLLLLDLMQRKHSRLPPGCLGSLMRCLLRPVVKINKCVSTSGFRLVTVLNSCESSSVNPGEARKQKMTI